MLMNEAENKNRRRKGRQGEREGQERREDKLGERERIRNREKGKMSGHFRNIECPAQSLCNPTAVGWVCPWSTGPA